MAIPYEVRRTFEPMKSSLKALRACRLAIQAVPARCPTCRGGLDRTVYAPLIERLDDVFWRFEHLPNQSIADCVLDEDESFEWMGMPVHCPTCLTDLPALHQVGVTLATLQQLEHEQRAAYDDDDMEKEWLECELHAKALYGDTSRMTMSPSRRAQVCPVADR